jgi:hypothetical protein
MDEIFFIPVRLDGCTLPGRISEQIQYIDLFPDWDAGVRKVLAVMKIQKENRKKKRLALAG